MILHIQLDIIQLRKQTNGATSVKENFIIPYT